MNEKRKIIVTGASGFIGKSFLKEIDFNKYTVSVITRDPNKAFLNQDKISVLKGDLSDLDSLISAFENQEIVVNLAAEVRNKDLLEKTNVQGTKNLISAIQKTSIKKVIHLSSVGVLGVGYQNSATRVEENFPSAPDNEYERTKKISEDLFLASLENFPLELTILRPTNVFGPNHPFDALLHMLKHSRANKPLLCTKGAKVNYLYVDDLTHCVMHFLNIKAQSEIYNVGSSMDLKAFYQLIKLKLPSQSRIINVPTIMVKLASRMGLKKLNIISNQVAYSDDKLKSLITYPKGIEIGLIETIDYYKERKLLE